MKLRTPGEAWKTKAWISLLGVLALIASAAVQPTSAQVDPASPITAQAGGSALPAETDDDAGDDDDGGDDAKDGVEFDDDDSDSGTNNVVRINNRADGRLRVRGRVHLNRIKGDRVDAVNFAYARSSCTDCQSIAVALQINLVKPGASYVAPENVAIALNEACTRCHTIARALQYTFSVENPDDVPDSVAGLIREMNRELRDVHQSSRDLTVEQAEARVNAVIAQFRELATALRDQRDEATAQDTPPKPTPQLPPPSTPTTGPAPEATPTATTEPLATPTPSATVGPTATPSAEPAATPSPTSAAG